MSTFGKILAFFNVFVATVFLVVAGMDYGRQQSWTYSEFRHHLLLTGLPVNNEEIDEQNPQSDDYLVDRLSKGVLDDVFQGNDGERNDLGGESVKTLFEEVDRVRVKLHKSIEDELAAADALAEPQKQQ